MGIYLMTTERFNAARRAAHPELEPGQPDEWRRWMEAEGIAWRHTYRFELDADAMTITVYRFAQDPWIGGIACDEHGAPKRAAPTTHRITRLPPPWVLNALTEYEPEAGAG